MLANHSTVVSGLSIGYARLGKMASKGATPKLNLNGYDVGMTVLGVAMATKDMLI